MLFRSDADDLIGGRRPKKRLKPLFTQQAAPAQSQTPAAAMPSQPQAGMAAAVANASSGVRPNPLPQTKTEKKIPVFKKGTLGISLHNHRAQQAAAAQQAAKTQNTASGSSQEMNNANYEDYEVYEKDLNYYWRDFAARLPKEEKANSSRMMNMTPKLLDATTFEVLVDNEMVEKYISPMIPAIQNHLRKELHNRRITMKIRVSEANENVRAYSHVERFQMMSQQNPALLKLKEAFNLELA